MSTKSKMLTGTTSRHERELNDKKMLKKKKQRLWRRIFLIIIGMIIICGIAVYGYMNKQQATHDSSTELSSGQPKTDSLINSSQNEIGSAGNSQNSTPEKNIFEGVAQDIKPTDYINNVYGKTPALYLIIGNGDDMRIKSLAQLMKTDKDKLKAKVPIYYVDANKYLHGQDDQQKVATLQLLSSLNLVKVDDKTVPNDVKFTSTMYANKLTKVDNKAAYKSYNADGQVFTDQKALLAFFDAANSELAK